MTSTNHSTGTFVFLILGMYRGDSALLEKHPCPGPYFTDKCTANLGYSRIENLLRPLPLNLRVISARSALNRSSLSVISTTVGYGVVTS